MREVPRRPPPPHPCPRLRTWPLYTNPPPVQKSHVAYTKCQQAIVVGGAVWCSLVQCVVVCCSVSQCVHESCRIQHVSTSNCGRWCSVVQCGAVCCSVHMSHVAYNMCKQVIPPHTCQRVTPQVKVSCHHTQSQRVLLQHVPTSNITAHLPTSVYIYIYIYLV